jgi:hypothetical protein
LVENRPNRSASRVAFNFKSPLMENVKGTPA